MTDTLSNSNASTQRWGQGKREQDKSRGQQNILEAAKRCFASKGMKETTFDDIALEANISRRTIYRYFDNKVSIQEALIDAQVEGFFEQFKLQLSHKPGQFIDLLETLMLYFITHGPKDSDHELFLGELNAEYSRAYYLNSELAQSLGSEMIEPAFEQAKKDGEIRQDISYQELMQWVGRITYSFIELPTQKQSCKKMIRQFFLQALT